MIVFFNPTSNTPNIVYRRRGEHYGLLQPQLA